MSQSGKEQKKNVEIYQTNKKKTKNKSKSTKQKKKH